MAIKKFFTAALLVIGLAAVSCKKDGTDKENALSPEDIYWSVTSQLVNDQNQITIGSPDNGDQSVRIVGVNSLQAAVNRYNTLVGANIDENTNSHTYSSKEVGTLKWTRSTDNRSWGVVDVSIPRIPALQKIIFRSGAQGDVNGNVAGGGSAYYRFGDVISQTREDGVREYWVCVRPGFDPEYKGASHWVSLSPLPDEHIWPYYKTGQPFVGVNEMEYGLPYKIGVDLEWAQDFVEMLFAIMYPQDWMDNIRAYSKMGSLDTPIGLPIFNDFSVKLIDYHNVAFWQNVQAKWKELDIVRKLMDVPYEDIAAAIRQDDAGASGLNFLYYHYDWKTGLSNKAKLWHVKYSHTGVKSVEKNMHTEDKTTPFVQIVDPKSKTTESSKNFPLNIKDKAYIIEPRFFGDSNPRWVIRYAEGFELSKDGTYDPQQPLDGYQNGEVYRYYRDVFPDKNLTDKPEITE